MGLIFNKMKEPVFLKETSNAEEQLQQLKNLEPLLNEEGRKVINQDITCLEYGIAGEKNIAFELKNSHMPMYILHDIYLESDDLNAQIDYLVFTRKLCFVIECKNLYGNITIDANGNFVRTMYFGTRKVQEGLYSPITQNVRHLELMKKIKLESTDSIVKKAMIKSAFPLIYQSVVVLANPKTILNDRYAKKEVRNQVIRADQLVKYIKTLNDSSKEASFSDEEMLAWAQSFLTLSRPNDKTYLNKYDQYKIEKNNEEKKESPDSMICPRCGGKLIQRKGKFGEFIGCSNFPKCRYTSQINSDNYNTL